MERFLAPACIVWFLGWWWWSFHVPSTAVMQIDLSLYVLSSAMFAMGCLVNACTWLLVSSYEKKSVAVITFVMMGLASYVDARISLGEGSVIRAYNGLSLPLERYALWSASTSLMLVTMTMKGNFHERLTIIIINNVMLGTGLASQISGNIALFMLSSACMMLTFVRLHVVTADHLLRRRVVYLLTLAAWTAFPVIDMLATLGVLSPSNAELCTVIINFGAKAVYSQILAVDHEQELYMDQLMKYESSINKQREVLHMVAHELRTPLNSIIHLSTSIHEGTHGMLSRKGNLYLKTILKSAKRMTDLINDILEIASLKFKGSIVLNKKSFDVRSMVWHIETAIRPLVHDNVLFVCTVDESVPDAVIADEARIMQVLFNLLGNSSKHTSLGSIDMCVRYSKEELIIEVEDTGDGMTTENIPDIFEAFRGNVGYGGTGLGLSITKAITDAHGGSINVTSKRGVGTRFTVRIPANVGQLVLKSDNMTILSIDDEPASQTVIREIFEKEGFTVVEAESGKEALAYLRGAEQPALIIVDYFMPEMNGVEFCKYARDEMGISVPIVMVSGSKALVVDLHTSGANEFVQKPFDRKELVSKSKRFIRDAEYVNEKIKISSDNILSHILPPRVLSKMQAGQTAIAEAHDNVCILFSDIVGFTTLCDELPTVEIYSLLNRMFGEFDKNIDRFGVYKVETIGDAYMVAAGHDETAVTKALGSPVYRIIQFARSMLNACKNIFTSQGERIRIRLGIHCGPCYSGVIGTRCPRYCFFGDTVNTASRMESHGIPGLIHVSSAVVDAYNDVTAFQCIGPRRIKGKGIMTTYIFITDPELIAQAMRDAERDEQIAAATATATTVALTRRQSRATEASPVASSRTSFDDVVRDAIISEEDVKLLCDKGLGVRSLAFASMHDLEVIGVTSTATRIRLLSTIERFARMFLARNTTDDPY
jgi:signal transduction histidine kinase/class 3 adenylate cyclase